MFACPTIRTSPWAGTPARAATSADMDTSGYPFTNLIVGNTPETFEDALRLTRSACWPAEGPAHPDHQLLERMDRGQLPRA